MEAMEFPGTAWILGLAVLVQVRLPAAGTLQGRILSAASGKPVPGAEVSIVKADRRAVSDSAGRFRLDSLQPGAYDLLVRHPEYEAALIHNVILLGNAAEEREVELMPPSLALEESRVAAVPVQKIYDMPNSTHVIDAEEIRRTPGALMDVQRVVQKFPGVQARGDNVNEVIARGGFPGENLFILDGIEIPNPNYFGNQGTGGGVISVVNPLMVKKLTFNSGAPPARYGGKASSVLDVDLRDGNPELLFGGIDLGFSGAGLLAEGPLWPGASFLTAFKKSYLDVVAEFEPSTAIPRFWGGQAKVSQKLGNGSLIADGLIGKSAIRIEDAEESFGTEGDVIEAGGDVFAAGSTWKGYSGERWEFSSTVSGTGNVIRREQYFRDADTVPSRRETGEYESTVKGEADYFAENRAKWSVGGEFKWIAFRDHDRGLPDTLRTYAGASDTLGTPVTDASGKAVEKFIAPSSRLDTHKEALFASVDFAASRRLFLALGVRGERFDYPDDWDLMPRASARWSWRENLDLTAAAGLQAQSQNLADYAVSGGSAAGGNRGLPSKRAATASLEMDWYPRKHLTNLGLNVYVKRYDNLVLDAVYADARPLFRFQGSPRRLDDGEALSRGAELFLERKLAGNWFASLAYSYSEADTRFRGVNGDEWFPSDFDYTHVANLTGGGVCDLLGREWYRNLRETLWFKSLCWLVPLGDRMEASFRFRYSTGRPYTPLAYDPGFRRWTLAADAVNSERFPDYYSLDLRLEKRLGYGWLRMMFYFDFQNVLGRDNVFTYVYNDHTGKRVTVKQLPFFPMGGFIIGF
ncbi:MAG TPA: TonB-dependent receptor [Fibrobacteria bacterium]|nr:TonB-dependent receptor [Fibrobacteria bacterium]